MEGQNNIFRRLKLEQNAKWEELGEVARRQGNALVSYDGKIFQVGGFEAKNKTGDEQDIQSTNEFAAFDPATGNWTKLTALPESRSSFDAAVHNGTLFVIGGWSLNGKGQESTWHETAWKIDLNDASAEWQPIKTPPFVRRANSVGYFNDKIYVIGGMAQRGGPTNKVAIYDPAANTWSEGPDVPGDNMQGFGTSTFNVGGDMVVSTANGQILKLNEDGSDWVKLHQMESGRFFHRLVAIDNHRLVVLGGTGGKSGKQHSVLVYDLQQLKGYEKTTPQTETKKANGSDAGK
jgi:N-acetylneuraminic acid mutarotase